MIPISGIYLEKQRLFLKNSGFSRCPLILFLLLVNNLISIGESFIFVDKFDREVVEAQFPGKKLYTVLTEAAIVKLNSEIEVDKAGKSFPAFYILDFGWKRILYNKQLLKKH